MTNPVPVSQLPRPVGFAIVGCGRVSPTHIDAITSLGDEGRLVAVCDTDPEALKAAVEKTGATGYANLEELLQDPEVNLVSICTPSGLHAEQSIAAAKAGKHVLVEKPMAMTLESAEELIQSCEEHGVQLFPVFQNRLNTTVQLLKAAVEQGRFGKIYAINSRMIWKRSQDYYDSAEWRGTKAMDGGCFMNQGIHFVDAMRFIGGEIIDVKSTLATLARDIESEDIGSALFRFESGALGNIFCTTLGRSDMEGSLEVLGETGYARLGGGCLNKITHWDFEKPNEDMDQKAADADYQSQSVYGYGHNTFYVKVVRYLEGGPSEPPDAPESRHTLTILLKITNTP